MPIGCLLLSHHISRLLGFLALAPFWLYCFMYMYRSRIFTGFFKLSSAWHCLSPPYCTESTVLVVPFPLPVLHLTRRLESILVKQKTFIMFVKTLKRACVRIPKYYVEVNFSYFAQNLQVVPFGVWIDCPKPAEKVPNSYSDIPTNIGTQFNVDFNLEYLTSSVAR